MPLKDLSKRAMAVRRLYAEKEKQMYGKSWTREEIMLGFVGDVGDLSKLLQAKEGIRKIENADQKLGHELSDCLWSLLILAEEYDIDLETEFLKTMEKLEIKLKCPNPR